MSKRSSRVRLSMSLFFFGEQVHQQRGEARLLQHAGDELVALAVPAAAAAVREQHDAARHDGQHEIRVQHTLPRSPGSGTFCAWLESDLTFIRPNA